MKYASMGFSKQTIYKWIQEKDSPSEKVKPGPEKTLNHEQLLKLRKDMLDACTARASYSARVA